MDHLKYTERQLSILTILQNQTFSQKNLSDMYEGALMVKNFEENPEFIYQAAHSLRELIDYTTKHLKQLGARDRKNQIRIFIQNFDPLGGLNQEAVLNQWVDLYNYFAPLSHHHDNVSPPELFEEKLYLLENVMLAIHGPISVPFTELDKMIAKENPTAEDLEIVLSLIKNISSYEYFFTHLTQPDWLDLFEKKKVYKNIPKFGERSVESLFLLKVAKQKADLVLDIIKRHSETDHPGARVNYIKCLAQIPPDSIVQMIKPLKKWINSQVNYAPSFYFVLVNLVLNLIKNNKEDELFDLLNSIFAIKVEILENDEMLRKKLDDIFDKRRKNGDIDQYGMDDIDQQDLGGEFQEESECYSYESLIRKILLDLNKKYPIKSFKLFLKNLNFALDFFLKNSDTKSSFDDNSLIWRRKITEKALSKTFRGVLIDAVIEIILYIGNNVMQRFPELISELKKFDKLIFRRLEFFAYNQFPELSSDFISKIKIRNELFKKINENFELFTLFKSFFERFPEEIRNSYLNYITKGLRKQYKKTLKKRNWNKNLPELKKTDKVRIIKHDQIRKIKPIKNYIEQDFLNNLEISSLEIDQITLFKDRGIIFGTKSPLSESVIENYTMEELKAYLFKYDEEKSFDFDTIGLSRLLENHIPTRPKDFITMLNDMLSHPKLHKYIPFIISGLNSTLKGNQKINLNRLFKIFKILLSEDFIADKEPLFFKDNTDRDIKKKIADFIHENLKSDKISLKFNQKVWDLIVMLLNFKDVNKEKEIEGIQRKWMPRDISINTVQGITTNSIFAYMSWVLAFIPDKYKNESIAKCFPKIFEVIQNLLNGDLYTTRYIIGTNFYYLCHLDLDWVKSNINIILPHDEEHIEYFEAAWSGFIDYNGIIIPFFELIRPSFLYALRLINEEFELIPYSKVRFINIIMISYIEGLEELTDEDSLISIFFNLASGENRKYAIRNIGTNLTKYQGDADIKKKKERFISLLEFRLEKASTENITNYIEELNSFIFWFRNSIFEDEWTINKLFEIARLLNDSFKEIYFIPEILEGYAVEYPVQVIGCLEIIIKKEIESGFIMFENKYNEILNVILNSESDESKQKANNIIDDLLRRNFHNFRDLLADSKLR